MLHLLDSIQDVMSSDPALVERLSSTAFVTTNAALAAPAALYDPRNEELVALLDADRHFPSGPFRKDDKVLLCPSSHICRIFVCALLILSRAYHHTSYCFWSRCWMRSKLWG